MDIIYVTDGIYTEWSVLVKSISQLGVNDTKLIRYKQAYEALRKYVKRAFGMLMKNYLKKCTANDSKKDKLIWCTHALYYIIW